MKKYLVVLLILLLANSILGQKFVTKKGKWLMPFSNFVMVYNNEESFIISKHLVSNKEYICFLMWTYRIEPNQFSERLPDSVFISELFNPENSNIEVKGITHKIANDFCRWRTDRLNEYILIDIGIFYEDFQQSDAYYFNTELYLTQLFKGSVKTAFMDTNGLQRAPNHSDHILVPRFFIPTKKHLDLCKTIAKSSYIKNPKTIKSDIDWWYLNEILLLATKNETTPFSSYISKLTKGKPINKKELTKIIKLQNRQLYLKNVNFDYHDSILFSDKNYSKNNLKIYSKDLLYYKNFVEHFPNPFAREVAATNYFLKEGNGLNFTYIADNDDGSPILIFSSVFEEKNLNLENKSSSFYYIMNIPYVLQKK